MTSHRVAALTVRILAVLGVALWAYLVIRRISEGWPEGSWSVLAAAIILAAAHAGVGLAVPGRRTVALTLAAFILVADVALTLVVDPRAAVLAVAAVVLLIAAHRACPRS